MSTKYKFEDQNKIYFVSFAVVDWIDVFIRPLYKDIFVESLKYCQENKGLELYAWCVMTSHIHLIIGTNGTEKLENIMRDLKKFTSKNIHNAIQKNPQESRKEWLLEAFKQAGIRNSNNTNFQFWQQDNHPIALNTYTMSEQKLNYLHENPVKEGFCFEPQMYPYSSAIDYQGGKGLLDILFLFG
ncbi:MAG: transposase [Bacteroidetes bacterium]|nr:MAG: transposase [Bacteroidota bacterium]